MKDELTIALREELFHSGRKGMHWGVRLYQNKDGSLTPLGRIHYRKERKKQIKQELKDAAKAEKRELKEAKKKKNTAQSLANMSDDELRAAIARKQLEAQYMSYMPKKEKSRGRKFAEKFIDEAVIPGLTSAGKDAIERTLKDITTAQIDKAEKKRKENPDAKTLQKLRDTKEKLTLSDEIKKLREGTKSSKDTMDDAQNKLKAYVYQQQLERLMSGGEAVPLYSPSKGGSSKKTKYKISKDDKKRLNQILANKF